MKAAADVLLVTVTQVESLAVLAAFEPLAGRKARLETLGDKAYHDLGTVNGAGEDGTMAGNVWEWTRTPSVANYLPEDHRPQAEGNGKVSCVLRGDSFYLSSLLARSAYRGLVPSRPPGRPHQFSGWCRPHSNETTPIL